MTMDSDTTKLGLHDLPPETLQQIARHLASSHRPSLYAFGLASQTCHGATIPTVFRHIRLTVSSRELLQRNVAALVAALVRTESARHVRCLSIRGSLCLPRRPKVEGYKSGTKDTHTWFRSTGLDEILVDEEPFCSSPHVVYDEPLIEEGSEEDVAWASVVSLVKTLPHLAKLVYDCRSQFPPSLLDALHSHHPWCRLYHLTFKLRTLLWGTPKPYEMALATSPCLYGVKVECSRRDSEGDDDFNQEAVMELAAGLAPNLREVVVLNLRPENAPRYDRRPREQWRGLPGFVSGGSIGSLTSLSLIGATQFRWLWRAILQPWAKHTDFRHLHHLALGGGYGYSPGLNDEVLEWVAQNCSFSRLKTLRIHLDRDCSRVERPNYAKNAIALFRGLEPLEELSVEGSLEPGILDAILYRHGQTLTKLSLRPSEQEHTVDAEWDRIRPFMPMVFQKEHILQIQAQCPALQELAISVKRTKSDATEAEIYKSFGKMERLRSLFLTLDCSDWQVARDPDSRDESAFDAQDHETFTWHDYVKKGHVREALINCAVDETLACSIWDAICQSKAGQQLESLRLWTRDGGNWGKGRSSGGVIAHLSRSWLVERVSCDDGRDGIKVVELGRRAREARDQEFTERHEELARRTGRDPEYFAERSDCLKIFRRVWPRREGSKDWRKDWSSFPLQI